MEVQRFSLTDLENMVPFEREVYIQIVLAREKEKAQQQKQLEAKYKAKR